jgi:hypothetical protein
MNIDGKSISEEAYATDKAQQEKSIKQSALLVLFSGVRKQDLVLV